MSFSGCGTVIRTKIELIEPERLPVAMTAEITGFEWDGDRTYQGLAVHIKRLQQCIEQYKLRLKQIREWEENQAEIIRRKKAELNLE